VSLGDCSPRLVYLFPAHRCRSRLHRCFHAAYLCRRLPHHRQRRSRPCSPPHLFQRSLLICKPSDQPHQQALAPCLPARAVARAHQALARNRLSMPHQAVPNLSSNCSPLPPRALNWNSRSSLFARLHWPRHVHAPCAWQSNARVVRLHDHRFRHRCRNRSRHGCLLGLRRRPRVDPRTPLRVRTRSRHSCLSHRRAHCRTPAQDPDSHQLRQRGTPVCAHLVRAR
jgi:hypothetical protein